MRGLIKKLSYRSKLLLNFAALFIVFAILLVCFQYHREKLYRWELLETRLRSYSDLVANSLESRGVDNDSVQLAAIMRMMPAELRLTVVSREGKVKYDSNTGLGEKLDDHSNRPEVHQAMIMLRAVMSVCHTQQALPISIMPRAMAVLWCVWRCPIPRPFRIS